MTKASKSTKYPKVDASAIVGEVQRAFITLIIIVNHTLQ